MPCRHKVLKGQAVTSAFPYHVFIVNDDRFQRITLVNSLRKKGFSKCFGVEDIDDLSRYASRDALIAVLDVDLGGDGNAYERYPALAKLGNLLGAIVYSAYPEDITRSVYNLLCSAGIKQVFNLNKSKPLSELISQIQEITQTSQIFEERFLNAGSESLFEQCNDLRITPRYQPQFYAHSGVLCGFEVLGRMTDEFGDIHTPSEFISQLVESGKITSYTHKLIHKAISEITGKTEIPVSLSFNIDYQSLEEDTFSEEIVSLLQRLNYPFNLVTLEVTETGFSRSETTYQNLIRFRLSGINISIDDFDLQQATINEFLAFPFREVKFDKSLLYKSGSDEKLFQLLLSFCESCKRLGISIVVEGIESLDDEFQAKRLGADKVQGYYYHAPLNIEQALAII